MISAHAADFVWRCGGAMALHQKLGYEVTVVCLSYGERGESAGLWKQEGMTLERVEATRRSEAERAAAALSVHDIQFFDLGDYPLELDREAKYRLVDVIVAQKFHGRGVAPRRIDHVNLLAPDVEAIEAFMTGALGARVSEKIVLDDGGLAGAWFTVVNRTYDLACARDRASVPNWLHHVTYATDQREDILRAADIFLENGVHIETGPRKHAIHGTFFLYVWEPAGNRIELANAGARLILAPDWQPVVWTEAERRKGQAWGLQTIASFHPHGTPPVPDRGDPR